MARAGDSNTSGSSWKSSDHHRDLLNNKAVFCSGLLSKSQDSTHVIQDTWPDLYSRDQLDSDASLLGRDCWF